MDRDFLAMLMEYIMGQQQPAAGSVYGAQGDMGGMGGAAPVVPATMPGPMPLPDQGNRASTPPRTGMLPNGNPFPGQGEGARPQRFPTLPPPFKATTAKKRYYPTGYTGPRGADPPSPSAGTPPLWTPATPPTPRPTRPVPPHTNVTGSGPKGISYPIQAAKRIQQAASKPPAAPMSPLTKRR
jgi:hypothetical protein